MNQLSNLDKLTDDTILGIFDTDGCIAFCIDSSEKKKKRFPPFRLRIGYFLELSASKTDLVQKFAKTFDSNARIVVSQNKASFRLNSGSKIGMDFRRFLFNNNPRHPGRFHDFLLSEEVLALIRSNAHETREGLVVLITLAYNNKVSEQKGGSRRSMCIEEWIELINPSQIELLKGLERANSILNTVRIKVSELESILPTMKFSTNYVRGAHFGDGFLTVCLSWDSKKRRRTEFSWGICGENKFYCEAFVFTFGGYVNKTGSNCYSFVLAGTLKCIDVFYIFEETWMPSYKREQFVRFQKAIALIKNKQHFTIRGTKQLLDLVYDMSEKGARSRTKEQLLEIGIEWLKNRKFV